MAIIRKDILERTPEIGDIVTFNPPYYKGLLIGKVVGFAKSGLPLLEVEEWEGEVATPKTQFAIIKRFNHNNPL
jgi:polyphosphate kinase 2 (PPK2 family)